MELKIMNYASVHAFLKDYYQHRKHKGKSFSFESWAREIQYPHRSNLRLIVTGKRALSPVLENSLKKSLFKTAKERKYFAILCEISREKSPQKKAALELVAQNLKQQKEVRVQSKGVLEEDILSAISIIMFLGFEDIDRTAKGIAKGLRMIESDLKKTLGMLSQNNLVEARLNGKGIEEWHTQGQFTVFDDDMGNEKLAAFHRQSFMRAIAAQSLSKKVRRFDSLMLPLSAGDYTQFCEDLSRFMDEQFYKYNSNTLKGKEIYQLQLGLFPALAN